MVDKQGRDIQLFGFRISRVTDENEKNKNIQSFVPPENEDASLPVNEGGVFGTSLNIAKTNVKSEMELITRYRDAAAQPEADRAIDDIVNETVVVSKTDQPVSIVLDEIDDLSDTMKEKIRAEFDYILSLLKFSDHGYDIVRKWYVDGRIYYHVMIDVQKPKEGIKELRYIDPRKIKKMRTKRKISPGKVELENNSKIIFNKFDEYYLYAPKGISASQKGIKVSTDSILFAHSGIQSRDNKMILSHLHKALKPLNNLMMLEDATVIYRLARAPERRVFYIDVGSLPKPKAEQYLRDIMIKHKNKLIYDPNTGAIRDDRKFMTMLEDYWLPRREGGRGTEITTLPGGENLGQIEDVEYFRRKLYESLNVPISRLESDNVFNIGRSSEITRDEIKFNRFVQRLRSRFSQLFTMALEKQLLLKNIVTSKDWQLIKDRLYYNFLEDNHYTELKEADILTQRLQLLNEIDPFVGRYFSPDWVKTNVLRQTEDEIGLEQTKMDAYNEANPPEGLDQEDF